MLKLFFCADCKQACAGEWVDFGIGPYEYWGAPAVDVRWEFVSECCEAEVVDDAGWQITGDDDRCAE